MAARICVSASRPRSRKPRYGTDGFRRCPLPTEVRGRRLRAGDEKHVAAGSFGPGLSDAHRAGAVPVPAGYGGMPDRLPRATEDGFVRPAGADVLQGEA